MNRTTTSCAMLLILSGAALAQSPADAPATPAADPAAAQPGELAAESAIEPSVDPDAEPVVDTDSEQAADAGQQSPNGPRGLAGMSILGNQEAPTSLVIVPWKSSEIGDGIGVSRALDSGISPVDKDVFMRELRYYEIRTGDGT